MQSDRKTPGEKKENVSVKTLRSSLKREKKKGDGPEKGKL